MMTTLQAVSLQPSSGACFAKESGPREGLEGDWEGEDLKVQMMMICDEDVLISGNIQTTNPVNISHVLKFTHLIKRPCLKKHASCTGGPHTNLDCFVSQVSIEAEGGAGKWRVGATVGNSLSCEVTQVLKLSLFIFHQKYKNAK